MINVIYWLIIYKGLLATFIYLICVATLVCYKPMIYVLMVVNVYFKFLTLYLKVIDKIKRCWNVEVLKEWRDSCEQILINILNIKMWIESQ
jgi:hypothetical protein